MIDVVLSLLLQVVIEKLASPVLEKLRDLYNLRENIKKLQHSLPMVQALLEDAEKQQSTEETIKVWLLELKDVTYESEDLWDKLAAEITLCESRSSIKDQVHSFLLPFEPTRNLFYLANKLQDKLKDLDEIVEEGLRFNLREGALERGNECLGRRRGTGSFVIGSEIYGREEDKKKILEILLRTCKGKSIGGVPVIPIVGIGGLGKTSLARLVYNDEKVSSYFDLKIWVYVSEVFDVRKVIVSIVEAATKRECKRLDMDMLQCQLRRSLCGKKFLLVLDDVWNEDREEWDELGDLFKSCVEGSKIIVTTRSKRVASIMGSSSQYHLKGLLEDDSWVLFKKQALFQEEEEEKRPNLLAIGKRIVDKCAGVPLAVKVLGSLLRLKRDEEEWLFVQDSELWNIRECQNSILPALRLSYTCLPLHLKRCLMFCSLYPKKGDIQKEKLIHIWMAQGLIIQPSGGNRPLEDIGNEYFDDLLYLSFIQEVKKCEDGTVVDYKMHDLIHDLAQSIGGNEFLILRHCLAPSDLTRTRHSSIVCNFDRSSFPKALFEAKHLRTLMFFFPISDTEELPSYLLEHFIYLRVLDLSGCGIKRLPESIGASICLRYLDLSNNPFQTLPYTICNLCNLQTLNLSGCYNLVELPFGLASLVGLRHVNTTGCEALTCMPIGIGKLIHLQTLPIYIVGTGPGERISELKSLNLRGELNIKCLENVRDENEAKRANLRAKKYLLHLRLQWGNGNLTFNIKRAKDVLECLEAHPNLKKLFIKGYPGIEFPRWNLPNLAVITFIKCRKCKYLPSLGRLPFLETLCLQGMDDVTVISEEFYFRGTGKQFPSLKDLTLRDFPNLVKWSGIDSTEVFPCLQKLIIDKCPKLKTSPVFPALQHLELRDCHPEIINSIENIASLSVLVIDMFPKLLHLSEKLLKNNTGLASLEIHSCKNLRSLPSNLELLTTLKSLIISSCEELSSLPLELKMLEDLEFLEINGCHKLIMLPLDRITGLSSLKALSIENCANLRSLSSGLCHLTALEQFSIMSCPKLAFLPDSLQNLSSLRSLNVVSCPELTTLPESLQSSTSLQTLVIHSCTGLTHLPSWFGNLSSLRSLSILNCEYLIKLPEGLQCLGKLQHLSIQDCPHLERRCKKKKGKEWQKIAHIPYKYIGSLKFGKYLSSSTA